MDTNFDTAFAAYVAVVQAKNSASGMGRTVEAMIGPRYVRVVIVNDIFQRSCHSFVDRKNGDILKCGSWKAPAPNGRRGSIYDDDHGAGCVGPYGTNYLR